LSLLAIVLLKLAGKTVDKWDDNHLVTIEGGFLVVNHRKSIDDFAAELFIFQCKLPSFSVHLKLEFSSYPDPARSVGQFIAGLQGHSGLQSGSCPLGTDRPGL